MMLWILPIQLRSEKQQQIVIQKRPCLERQENLCGSRSERGNNRHIHTTLKILTQAMTPLIKSQEIKSDKGGLFAQKTKIL
jgi:hypothetical protein